MQHIGVAHELLVHQRHGPAAYHRFAKHRIGRLQRIVPVTLAVAHQMGAGYEALTDRREQLIHVDRD
jgi:hypothetical protein